MLMNHVALKSMCNLCQLTSDGRNEMIHALNETNVQLKHVHAAVENVRARARARTSIHPVYSH